MQATHPIFIIVSISQPQIIVIIWTKKSNILLLRLYYHFFAQTSTPKMSFWYFPDIFSTQLPNHFVHCISSALPSFDSEIFPYKSGLSQCYCVQEAPERRGFLHHCLKAVLQSCAAVNVLLHVDQSWRLFDTWKIYFLHRIPTYVFRAGLEKEPNLLTSLLFEFSAMCWSYETQPQMTGTECVLYSPSMDHGQIVLLPGNLLHSSCCLSHPQSEAE